MQIKIFKDLKKYTLTSTITKETMELVKKYKPVYLKEKDSDGNDIFAVSYVEGRPCISQKGITFGATNSNGYVMIVEDLPETLPEGVTYSDYVADKVGAVNSFVAFFESNLPEVAASIKEERAALMDGIIVE